MTTTSILTLGKLASTAVALYGIGLRKDDLKVSLTEDYAGFVSTQADQFVAQYKLRDQLQNVTFNGFSVTVFQDKVTNKKSSLFALWE